MKLNLNSKALGKIITFSRPGSSYVYADFNGQPGTLGNQICHGGGMMGSTITYDGSEQAEFEKICRNWFRAYLRNTAFER